MLVQRPWIHHVPSARVVLLALALTLSVSFPARTTHAASVGGVAADTVSVTLTEWKVELSPAKVPAGDVVFAIRNDGKIPHGFEIEGGGIEKSVENIPHGGSGTLRATLKGGRYEAYCPVGRGSHKMLGMVTSLAVGTARATAPVAAHATMHHDDDDDGAPARAPSAVHVTGGGPVIQILPGPYPFADSAAAVIAARPDDQREDLTHKAHVGPYSNNVARIDGTIDVIAIDRGASGDSVSGVAGFTAQDGARWKVVMDRVQTRDIPDNPRFGGVIMGLYYHGASGVHTPLVPTIQSQVALWAYAHVWRNDQLVTDGALVHIMLLSRTRRDGDFALSCWDCSRNPIEELQLQVTTPPGAPPFQAPGGFLFVNWEKSGEEPLAAR
jgi:hypothetical protein